MDFKKKKEKVVNIPWTREQEELLAEWSELSTCYKWLHSRCEKLYRFRNYTFTIPVIILSTLTGTANFAMDSFVPPENKQIAMAAVGSVNIFAGILSTLQNFLRYAELLESHRLSELQWSKFGRNISVELALEPKRRKSAHDFLKICRAEYDRLLEQSPTIDDNIIKQFKKQFKNVEIKKPDICNGLSRCKIYVPSKEEKVADIVATATNKFATKWKRPNTFKPPVEKVIKDRVDEESNKVPTEKWKEPTVIQTHEEKVVEKKKELSGIVSLGRVSEFSKAMNINSSSDNKSSSDNNSPMSNVVDELNEIQVIVQSDRESDNNDDDNDDDNDDNFDDKEERFLDGIKDD